MTLSANIGSYQAAVDGTLAEMARVRVLSRLWAHGHAIWKLGMRWLQSGPPRFSTRPSASRSGCATRALAFELCGAQAWTERER
jgi:hypothetical protein